MNILLVDDSPSVLSMLEQIINTMPNCKIVGKAKSGTEAISMAAITKPDVITLDIEMPGKSGLEVLPVVQKLSKAAVIMCSNLTQQGAEETFKALERGAFDYIAKDKISLSNNTALKERLIEAYAYVKKQRAGGSVLGSGSSVVPISSLPHLSEVKLIVVGTSTGGPAALSSLFEKLPKLRVPVVVVQHMPSAFVQPLATRLNINPQGWSVKLATNHEMLKPGVVYLAPGDAHTEIIKQGSEFAVRLVSEGKGELHKPSVNVLFHSAAEAAQKSLLAIILTGMGTDGREGCKTVKTRGGYLLAESASSCVVYGMPKAVIEDKLVNWEFPLKDVPSAVSKIISGQALV